VIELPAAELLSETEIEEITGCQRRRDQAEWLTTRGWVFELSRGGRPIVSRLYFRMRLAGVSPSAILPAALPAEPNWNAVR